jgi:hypothetical protein
MDEVQTGGGSTGKMWAHEWFELEHGPGKGTFIFYYVRLSGDLFELPNPST